MKSRPILLLLGAVLFAALPVRADKIPDLGLAKQPSTIVLFDGFDSNKTSNVFDPKSFTDPGAFGSVLSDMDRHFDGPIDLGFLEHGSSVSHEEKIWLPENWDHERYKRGGNDDPKPVPEPGSLSLSLLGLAAVGFFALGRAAWPRTN